MPDGEEEGIQVLQKIMKNNSKTKIIMISAVGQDLIVQKCKRLGAKDFIMKPFDKEQIVKTAEKYLNMD
jgi:two-component system chemotaxis response regulator CheY